MTREQAYDPRHVSVKPEAKRIAQAREAVALGPAAVCCPA